MAVSSLPMSAYMMGNGELPQPTGMDRFRAALTSPFSRDLALALLANSRGPNAGSFGQALGVSGLQAQAMGQQRQQQAIDNQFKAAQIQAMMQRVNNQPNSIEEFEYAKKNGYTGTYEQWRATQGTKAEPPASLQELEAVNRSRQAAGKPPYSIEDWYRVKSQMTPSNPFSVQIGEVPNIAFPNKFDPSKTVVMPVSNAATEQAGKAGMASAAASGKGTGERFQKFIDVGQDAADSMATVRRGLALLDEVQTGGIDAAKLKATNMFGVTGANEAELSANLGKAVLSQLRATFGAAFTEKEGAKLAEIEAGFGKSTEGNRRLLQQAEKILDRAARRGIDAAEQSGDTFSANEIRKAMEFTLTPPSNGPAVGTVKGGYKFKGGDPSKPENWVKQ